mgnify:CR=1 FL=1
MFNGDDPQVGMGSDPGSLRSYCKENGILHEAYSPLAHGDIFDVPQLAEVANETNKSAAQVLFTTSSVGFHPPLTMVSMLPMQVGLRWISQQGSAFVTRSDNPKHLAVCYNRLVAFIVH